MTDDRLVVGLVRGVHGLNGALRVEILSDSPDRFAVGSVVWREGDDRPLTVISALRDGPGFLIRFREVPDRRAADALRDAYLEAPAEQLAPGEHYWHDIIGCAVSTSSGRALGDVVDIFRVGESEVYVVRGPDGEVLVPSVASIVLDLDVLDKRMVVDTVALGIEGNEYEPDAD